LSLYEISAVTGKGIEKLKHAMAGEVQALRGQESPKAVPENP